MVEKENGKLVGGGGVTELMQLGPQQIVNIGKKLKNDFWKQVLSNVTPFMQGAIYMHPEKIILAPLWGNPFFLRNNKKLKITDFPIISKQIQKVADFFEPGTSRLLSRGELEQKYDLTIHETSLIELRFIIKQTIATIGLNIDTLKAPLYPSRPLLIDIVMMCQTGCSLYSRLLNVKHSHINSLNKREDRWHRELDCTFGIEFWKRAYILVYSMKDDNKLKWFQYQINRNSLFTNYKVSKFKPLVSHLCSFCGEQPELVSHLFKKCRLVDIFWVEIKEWLSTFNLDFPVTISQILFGSQDSKLNYIILCGKYFIWKARLTTKILSFSHFKKFLYSKLETKKHAYFYGEKQEKFAEWNDIYNNLLGLQCPTALAPMPTQILNQTRIEGMLSQ